MSKAKSRMTRQRRAILEELRQSNSHPTADEIYHRIRQTLPRISLGTVYRNLEMLSDSGMITKLDIGSSQKRYDGKNESHYHIRCIGCGRIDDLPIDSRLDIEDAFSYTCGYHITGHQLTLFGLCPDCKEKEKN
jgi:Fur family ferric uptake transcriptional regulator